MEITPGKISDPSAADNISKETIVADPNVQELKDLVSTPDFEANFLAVQTRTERVKRDKLLKTKSKNADYQREQQEANNTFEEAKAVQAQTLEQLKKELEHPNTELVEALSIWGRSRNAKGEKGPEQRGFNSGVIHYFEYRIHPRKNQKRFKLGDTFSIKAFVAYTKKGSRLANSQNYF